jgi:hypothetical protein
MPDTLTLAHLRELLACEADPSVSLFMPTTPGGQGTAKDIIRLKNLLTEAEGLLIERGLRSVEARQMLAPIAELEKSREFWIGSQTGLAIFLSSEMTRMFRLQTEFEPSVVVSDRFRIRPLLSAARAEQRFFILALSQNEAKLYAANRESIEAVDVPGLPRDKRSALNLDDADRGSQMHSGMRVGEGKQSAVFHGHGGTPESHKAELAAYFREVDKVLARHLGDSEVPLLLACVGYLAPIYRQANSYRALHPAVLEGNAEYDEPQQLLQRAWTIMEEHFDQTRRAAASRYEANLGTGKAVDDLDAIAQAAVDGRIAVLFQDPNAKLCGKVMDGSTVMVTGDVRDLDLIDWTARTTLSNGGEVYPTTDLVLPTSSPLAAILRY